MINKQVWATRLVYPTCGPSASHLKRVHPGSVAFGVGQERAVLGTVYEFHTTLARALCEP